MRRSKLISLSHSLQKGGGKKVRTAYGGPDGLLRDMCMALDKIGFKEDR